MSDNRKTEKQLLVQKFGGTSLADLAGFEASATVVGRYTDDYQVVVVLSAVKGVTDLLLAAIDTAVEGGDGAEYLEQAIERERAIVDDLAEQGVQTPLGSAFLDEQHATLTRRVEGIRLLGQCPDETRARILASGEGFSSRLMVDLLNHRGYRAQWSDTDVLPLANEDWLDSLVDTDAAAPAKTEAQQAAGQLVNGSGKLPGGKGTLLRQGDDGFFFRVLCNNGAEVFCNGGAEQGNVTAPVAVTFRCLRQWLCPSIGRCGPG